MSRSWVMAYRVLSRAAHRLPFPTDKLARSVAGRRTAGDRWSHWVRRRRGDGPLLWIHAASVGEALSAAPVVRHLQARLPTVQVVLSHSSSSVARWAGMNADHVEYVPLDEPAPVRRVLEALAPRALVFARGDVWPELVWGAAEREVPMAILGATVSATSWRLRWPIRRLYAALLPAIHWIGAVSSAHAERWIRLGGAPSTVTVTGDPRHDEMLTRAAEAQPPAALRAWAADGMALLAGSTERADERPVLRAFERVGAHHAGVRLLMVPHEPGLRTVHRLLGRAAALGIPAARWQLGRPPPEARVVIVEEVGLLRDLYGLAAGAYVGGGFRSGRLHSVAEPAAHGVPVVFGPRWEGADDAAALLAGGGCALPPRRPEHALRRIWHRWLTDAAERRRLGRAARDTLHRGAAGRTADAVLDLLGTGGQRSMIVPS